MIYIIVLYRDGSYLVYPKENFKFMSVNTFEVGAKFFETVGKSTIEDLSVWSSCKYDHKHFKEVDPWA